MQGQRYIEYILVKQLLYHVQYGFINKHERSYYSVKENSLNLYRELEYHFTNFFLNVNSFTLIL